MHYHHITCTLTPSHTHTTIIHTHYHHTHTHTTIISSLRPNRNKTTDVSTSSFLVICDTNLKPEGNYVGELYYTLLDLLHYALLCSSVLYYDLLSSSLSSSSPFSSSSSLSLSIGHIENVEGNGVNIEIFLFSGETFNLKVTDH